MIKKRRARVQSRKDSLGSFEESVKHKINQDVLSRVPNFPKIKVSLPLKRKETIAVLSAVVIILAFILMQLVLMNSTGIGTDEGNFVFTAKEIMQGKEPNLDFYVREAGSLLVLLPVLSVFGTTIESLRWIILVVHVLEIAVIAFLAFKLTNSKKLTIASMLLTIVLLQVNGPLDFYQGCFYQFSNLLSLAIISIVILKLFGHLEMSWRRTAVITGLLIGLDIISYKGSIILLGVIPFLVLLGANQKNRTRFAVPDVLIFFLSAGIPIGAYFAYFSIKTNFLHILQMAMGNVLASWLFALVFFFAIFKLFLAKRISVSNDIVVFCLNFLFVLVIIFRMFLDYSGTINSLYSGLVFINLFTLMTIQFFSIYFSGRFRKVIFYICFALNAFILVFGFGNRGFFSGPPIEYYLASTILFIVYNFVLFCFYLEKHEKHEHDKKIFVLGSALYLWVIMLSIGGKLMPTRFESALVLLPILILIIIKIKSKATTLIKLIFIVAVVLTVFMNSTLSNDYTLYPKNSFDSAVEYMHINLDSNQTVFSLDTALLSEIPNKSMIPFYSQHVYIIEEEYSDYYYPGLTETFAGYDITMRKDDVLERLMDTVPKYVIGSSRATMRIIVENDYINSWFNETYSLKANFGRIMIYERRI
ncbi:Uncharacterised protein [uncultured archaeon]|nr:Uncharacterised protein [uncultured archaeon]